MAVVEFEKQGHVALVTLKLESQISGTVFQTEDAKEGPKAFMEKRQPAHKGR